jgi:predicted ester cyclase
MMKRIALLGCLALLGGQAACKKEKKGADDKTPATDPTAGKTTEPTPDTPPQPEKPKLDTAEDKVAFYKACTGHMNAKHWDKFGACYTDSATFEHVDGGMPATSGRDAIVASLKDMATAYPDFTITPTMTLVNGNKLASAGVYTGTNSGPMKGPGGEMPATNKKVGVWYLSVVEIDPAAGGVAKEWLFSDMGTMMGQLGMHKMPVRAVAEKPAGEETVVIAKDDDAEKANVEAYKKGLDAFMKKDTKTMMAMWDDKAVMHDYGAPKDMDKKSSQKMMGEVLKAFPDAKGEIVDIWGAGEYVVAIVKNTGTNKGPMPSMGLKKATNKPMAFTGADVVKMANGKAVESWSFYNGMAIAQQLGMIPADAGKAPADGAADKGADMGGADGADKGAKGADKKPAKGAKEEKPAETGGANP